MLFENFMTNEDRSWSYALANFYVDIFNNLDFRCVASSKSIRSIAGVNIYKPGDKVFPLTRR